MTSSILTTPPAVEPVTLAEAKAHLRIEDAAEDALITALIVAARQWAEEYTGRAFINQTWQLWRDDWPETDWVELPRYPVVSVSQIQTFDDADAATTWNSANYFVDAARDFGRVVRRKAACWPLPSRSAQGVLIEYVAGYGASPSSVPEAIRLAIRQIVAAWHENRGDEKGDAMPSAMVAALLDPYRYRRL